MVNNQRQSASSVVPFVSLCLCGRESIMQNKANFKMGNMNISTAKTKAYAKEQRTMSNERYSKQTQSKPISNAQTTYSVRRTRDCHPFDYAQGRLPRNDYRPGCSARLAAARLRRASQGPILAAPPVALGPFAAARRVYSKDRRIDSFTVRNLTQNHRDFFHLNCVPRQHERRKARSTI